MGRGAAEVAGSVWLIWLLTAQGVIWSASSAPGPCATGCSVTVEPVCGIDARSYANRCVAACADVSVQHSGYCQGEKINFISPAASSSTKLTSVTAASQQPDWRLAKESAQVISMSTINRFIDQGYVYRGRVALSSMPVYTKQSSAGETAAPVADSLVNSSSNVQVAIVRVDNQGNMYQKTFTYDPKHFTSTAYKPFEPSNAAPHAAAAASPAPATSPAVSASAAILANSTDARSPPASLASPAPAVSIKRLSPPPATAAPAALSAVTAAANHSLVPAAVLSDLTKPVVASSSSNESTVVKSPPSPPPAAAAAASKSSPSASATAQSPSPDISKNLSTASPAASQPRPPMPATESPAAVPSAPARPSSGPSNSRSNAAASPPDQQVVAINLTAVPGKSMSSATGPSNAAAKAPSPSAAASNESDAFSMVVWSKNSNSSTGEILKPELGSYDNPAHDAPNSSAAISGNPVAASNSSNAAVGADTANSTALPKSSVQEPTVTVQGNDSAPGGTVTTVTFGNDTPEAGSPSPKVTADLPAALTPTTQPTPPPPCSPALQVCADKVAGFSRYFGTKPSAAKYMDQMPMVGQGRISGMVLYYNKSSKCLRGTQVMYNYVDHPTSYYTSVLLGNSVTKSSQIVVKTLTMGKNESIIKAEVYAPKCVQYLKLFTNRNNTVLAGTVDAKATLFTPAAKPGGRLVAIRGFQDKAVTKPATASMPATTVPGVLKQLQFIWGVRVCNCSSTAIAAPASPSVILPVERASVSTMSSSAGRRLAQVLQRAAASSSVVLDLEESQQLQQQRRQEWQRQRQLHKIWRRRQLSDVPAWAAGDSSSESVSTPLPWDLAAMGPDSHQNGEHDTGRFAALLAKVARGLDGDPPARDGPSIHRMLSVISPDSRLPCPVLQYPYNTLGQINAKAQDGGFVCSGGLIGPDRVLTAGHCVWDDRDTQGPFLDLAFAPAQWKRDGKITAPLGKVDWDYVTLFEAYINDPDGEGLGYDVAVITLSKPVGQQLGYLGVRADTSPCATVPMTLTLAGYPGDDPEYPIPGGWQGGCFYDDCQVNYSCSVSITNHTCDSYVGQSGAPMYDKQNYVRAVHTLGVLPGFSTSNGAITIQKFILDNIMGYWKETMGFTPAAPGTIGSGSNY